MGNAVSGCKPTMLMNAKEIMAVHAKCARLERCVAQLRSEKAELGKRSRELGMQLDQILSVVEEFRAKMGLPAFDRSKNIPFDKWPSMMKTSDHVDFDMEMESFCSSSDHSITLEATHPCESKQLEGLTPGRFVEDDEKDNATSAFRLTKRDAEESHRTPELLPWSPGELMIDEAATEDPPTAEEALSLTPIKTTHLMESTDALMSNKMTTMFFDDMSGLVFDKMANYSIVDFYLSLIVNKRGIPLSVLAAVDVFSSIFYMRLTEGIDAGSTNFIWGEKAAARRFAAVKQNYKAISTWANDVDIFDKDYILIPIVEDKHWYLIIIIKPRKCIVPDSDDVVKNQRSHGKGLIDTEDTATFAVILDSSYDVYDPKRQATIHIIRDYLELEYAKREGASNDGMVFDRSRISALRPLGLPQEKHFTDSGFALLQYAEAFLSRPPNEKLLHQGVPWSEWCPHFELNVSTMRKRVARAVKKTTDREVWSYYKKVADSHREEVNSTKKRKKCTVVPAHDPITAPRSLPVVDVDTFRRYSILKVSGWVKAVTGNKQLAKSFAKERINGTVMLRLNYKDLRDDFNLTHEMTMKLVSALECVKKTLSNGRNTK